MTDIIVRSQLGIPVIEIRGPFYRQDIDELRSTVQDRIADGSPNILLDLTSCNLMDSSGLGQLVESWRACENAGGALKFLGPLSPVIRRKMEISRLDTIFELFDNEPEAIASFTSFN